MTALTGGGLALAACNDSLPAVPLPPDSAVADSAASDASPDGVVVLPDSAGGDDGGAVQDSTVALGSAADDAAEAEASPDADDSAIADASGDSSLCAPMNFADCGVFSDLTGDAADRTIAFGNFQYAPKCAQVRSGQSVTFAGDFVVHPLVQACGPEDILERRLPITASPGVDASFAFTLRAVGVYGYYCLDHGNPRGDLMSGAIQVVP
ncbi:MAG: hypothetical protein M3O36_12030 [Myxococcota bacterium]|nr:hypothetical protein [Myxococcota bacterium]